VRGNGDDSVQSKKIIFVLKKYVTALLLIKFLLIFAGNSFKPYKIDL